MTTNSWIHWCMASLTAVLACVPIARGQPRELPPLTVPLTEFGVDRPTAVKPRGPTAVQAEQPATLRLPGTAPVPDTSPAPSSLDDLIRLALEKHPRISQATLAVEAAHGRAVQAGLYPNPVLSATADELLDRQGRAGILTIPQISQELVTGGKLTLSQAVAAKEVDQATLGILAERYRVIAAVRIAYFDAAALQRRAEYLNVLLALTTQSAARGKELFDAGNVAKLNLLQLELERERVSAEHESVLRELPGAMARLAAAVGVPTDRPAAPLATALDLMLPDYDLDKTREAVLASHPEVRMARVGIDRARIAVERARVEPIPNVTVTGGYVRQNQNKSNDFMVGVSLPVPAWNRNEGNIAAAHAQFSSAVREVNRAEVDLLDRLGTGFRTYAGAKKRAELYKSNLIPRAEESFKLLSDSVKVKGAPFEFLQVYQAQRAMTEARLEYVKSLAEAWRAAGELSGLLLEEQWPPKP